MKGTHRLAAPLLLVIGHTVAAASPVFAGADQAALILNAPDKSGTPRNYRSIKKLSASGSGQFSAKELDAVRAGTGGRPLLVLDLRQESHGFVDGAAVSWFSARDAANRGKTPDQISRDESALLAAVAGQPTVTVQKVTAKTPDRTSSASEPVELPVQTVQNENDVVGAAGGGYVRVYASDYQPFTDEEVDQLVNFWQSRAADAWVHVHCAAGDGRTTQALALFDMLENAGTTKLRDIVARQNDAGGIDLLSAKKTPPWRHEGEVARGRLVQRFYQYARQHPHGEGETWSSWSAQNP